MKPVYLQNEKFWELSRCLKESELHSIDDFPLIIKNEAQELIKCKILTKTKDEDEKVLKFIRSKIPQPNISVCYFILSEQCNLACKYCFLGNNDPEKRKKFTTKNMTIEIADKALDFFLHQIEIQGNAVDKPVIIFYGGEPFLNFEVLEYIASKIQKSSIAEHKNFDVSVITNGTLITDERLQRLKDLNVSLAISIDGCTEVANALRVDKAGKSSFQQVLTSLAKAKQNGLNVSLSITLTEETIKNKQKILDLIDEYNIKGIGFNILMSDANFKPNDEYNEKAAAFITDIFVELRKKGIYEDRIMRKLKAFSKSQVYFSDCAATTGGQLVIAPDGNIGICQGCLVDRKYFVTSVDDSSFNAATENMFIEWANLTPLNKEECLSCEALGICGGGCPINAMNSKEGNTIHSIDERFCVHAKKTLNFMIQDLYRIIKENNINV